MRGARVHDDDVPDDEEETCAIRLTRRRRPSTAAVAMAMACKTRGDPAGNYMGRLTFSC